MKPHERTLEQWEAMETARIATQLEKTQAGIDKLTSRLVGKTDPNEINRLNSAIASLTAYKENLLEIDVEATATAKYNKFQEKINKKIK